MPILCVLVNCLKMVYNKHIIYSRKIKTQVQNMAEQSLFMTNVYKDGENMYKVIVAEDERLIRSYICDFINEYVDGFCVAKSFMDGRDVLEYLAEHSVHVIVTDIRMLEISGIEVARYVYEQHLPIRVILLSGYQDFGYAQEAIDYHVQ